MRSRSSRFSVLELALGGGEPGVVTPPVDAHLLGLVDRHDEQPDPDGQQLDVEEVHLDVAGDDDALVEDPLEDVGQVGGRGATAGVARGGVARVSPGQDLSRTSLSPPAPNRACSGRRVGSPSGRPCRRCRSRSAPGRRSSRGCVVPPAPRRSPASRRRSARCPVTPSALLPVSRASCSAARLATSAADGRGLLSARGAEARRCVWLIRAGPSSAVPSSGAFLAGAFCAEPSWWRPLRRVRTWCPAGRSPCACGRPSREPTFSGRAACGESLDQRVLPGHGFLLGQHALLAEALDVVELLADAFWVVELGFGLVAATALRPRWCRAVEPAARSAVR